MFTFCIENHEPFWATDKELPKVGQELKYSDQIFSICNLQINS